MPYRDPGSDTAAIDPNPSATGASLAHLPDEGSTDVGRVVQSPIAAPTRRPRGRAGASRSWRWSSRACVVVTTALPAARVLARCCRHPRCSGRRRFLTNLQPGKQYTAELQQALPADWASYAEAQDGADIWVFRP
jgi:hypothetical protein